VLLPLVTKRKQKLETEQNNFLCQIPNADIRSKEVQSVEHITKL
jgi:hypothetical protein